MIDSVVNVQNLILAAAASPDPNWGSRKAKLDEINIQLLTSEEKAWYNMLVATLTSDGETYGMFNYSGLKANPDSPLINWFSIGGDWDGKSIKNLLKTQMLPTYDMHMVSLW